jgi:hypothetical protein
MNAFYALENKPPRHATYGLLTQKQPYRNAQTHYKTPRKSSILKDLQAFRWMNLKFCLIFFLAGTLPGCMLRVQHGGKYLFSRCSSVFPDGVILVCASDAAIVFLVVHSFLLLGDYRSIDGKEGGCG